MILVIDTSGPDCSVATCNCDCSQLNIKSERLGRGHAEHLIPMIEAVLQQDDIGWKNISAIGCTTGPGSFTGLRVGISTARGLALGLNVPCIGVGVFEAFSVLCEKPHCVVIDAKRDQLWFQHFHTSLQPASEPKAISVDETDQFSWPDNLIGSGSQLVKSVFQNTNVVALDPSPPAHGVAKAVVNAMKYDAAKNPPKPIYLRAPDAKPQSQQLNTAGIFQ